ncbi:MAG: 1-acyl-sn-glycerol-3-phosphate acyltransferase [Ferruginibacter sp.]|nr:1-acyl-sn-glycerol-3-phosphate acyltransferase [Ferruginibacter sp.]
MLYGLVKIIAKLAFRFYCRHLKITRPGLLNSGGPLLLAANHPNSFLDAIILCTLFKRPVYSLARGDAFKGQLLSRLLLSLKLLPVYRVSEGVENLEENYKTFDACKEIFKQNGIVLIFSEGRCVNEWHLRPLKKGTARLALSCWEDDIPLKVIPVGINYSSFRKFGKNIDLYFGEYFTASDIGTENGYGRSIQEFNQVLKARLRPFVYEIANNDSRELQRTFYRPVPALKKIILGIPAVLGWILNAPLYVLLKKVTNKILASSDHFDSVVVAMLFLTYPVYVSLLTLTAFLLTGQVASLLLLLLVPFTAWAYVQLKQQLDVQVDTRLSQPGVSPKTTASTNGEAAS